MTADIDGQKKRRETKMRKAQAYAAMLARHEVPHPLMAKKPG